MKLNFFQPAETTTYRWGFDGKQDFVDKINSKVNCPFRAKIIDGTVHISKIMISGFFPFDFHHLLSLPYCAISKGELVAHTEITFFIQKSKLYKIIYFGNVVLGLLLAGLLLHGGSVIAGYLVLGILILQSVFERAIYKVGMKHFKDNLIRCLNYL